MTRLRADPWPFPRDDIRIRTREIDGDLTLEDARQWVAALEKAIAELEERKR